MPNLQQLLNRTTFALKRRMAIAACEHLPVIERVELAFSRGLNSAALLSPRIQSSGSDFLKMQFAGFIFQMPCPAGLAERQLQREHFSQVVAETFIDPLFFAGPVIVRPGDTVLDLGGNIGTTAAFFSRQVGRGGRVYAFEPCVPEVLAHNISLNQLANVEVLPLAVGDSCATAQMSVGASGMDSTLVQKLAWHTETKTVSVVTLDSFVSERKIKRVDFIKMDIEGAEESAILGARELIRRDKPKWTISSYHTDFKGDKQHPKLLTLLKNLGYTVKELPGFHIYAY